MTIPTTTTGTLGRARTSIAAIVRRIAVISALAVAVFVLGGSAASAGAVALAADPARYKPYYAIFDRGSAKIPGHDTRWVPQGLAYWPQRDALLISYYDGVEKKNSRLAAIDRASGKRLQLYELNGDGHVGALAIAGPTCGSATAASCTATSCRC